MSLHFDHALEHTNPPSIDELSRELKRLSDKKAQLTQLLGQIEIMAWAVIATGSVFLFVAWQQGWFEGGTGNVMLLAMLVIIAAAGATTAETAMVGLLVVFWALAGAAAEFGNIKFVFGPVFGVMVIAMVAVFGVMVVAVPVVGNVINKYIHTPIKTADQALSALVELEARDRPDECIKLDEWRQQDDTIDAYLTVVSHLARKPVVGEYEAARAWMKSADERHREADKLERARQACERMAVAE